jgi:hypothetical protein
LAALGAAMPWFLGSKTRWPQTVQAAGWVIAAFEV